MRSRRQAREVALQALYQCDTLQDLSGTSVETFFAHFDVLTSSPEDSSNVLFCRTIIDGVLKNLESLDGYLSRCSINWPIARMARVDRNILRIAAFELVLLSDVPINVSINEAIEVAKRFGSEDSSTFINGVLDKLALRYAIEKITPTKEQSEEFKKVLSA